MLSLVAHVVFIINLHPQFIFELVCGLQGAWPIWAMVYRGCGLYGPWFMGAWSTGGVVCEGEQMEQVWEVEQVEEEQESQQEVE